LTKAKIKEPTTKRKIKRSKGEHAFDTFNIIFMLVMCVIMIYPFWYVLILAFNTGSDAIKGPMWLLPRQFTLDNFRLVLNYPGLHQAAIVTVMRCIVGPFINVFICLMVAFSLSKRFLPGRKAVIFFLMGPMFIGGTVVSNYIVMAKMGFLNNFLVYVIPGAFGYFTAVIMRSFIDGLPDALQESAMLDGAGYGTIFLRVILPLCTPCIAAFAFFAVVGHWLDMNTTLMFITKKSLYTLQYVMHLVLTSTESKNIINLDSNNTAQQLARLQDGKANLPTPQVIKMAIIVVVTFPILFVYPFFQKYFIKGMLTGAVKA
jgi:ABC-type sugar transport system, permease component